MLVSLKNINEYVSLEGLTAEQIANGLTFAGVEVEEIRHLASGTNLVIGEIKECVPHKDSDHLHVLKVDLGPKYGVEQIVCGAPNARTGLKVIVARPGSVLPGGEIKRGVIRGEESNGMCCSLLELGVEAKYLTEAQTKGIEELPSDALIGDENVLEYLGLDDVVLNLKVLANRPDLLSIYNVAREIAAIFSREVKIPSYPAVEDYDTKLKVGSKTDRCVQFSAKEVRGIVTKPSPSWMSHYLMAMGIRSINNIVDIGNYVMLLTGQPLHMYDADKLEKKELIARDDLNVEFIALDEQKYDVIPGDIVITSNNKAECLGGVMGAHDCAVDENTKNIYIEAASFDGASIRHTSSRLGLASESSQRFVKGTNHFQYEEVLNLVSYYMEKYCEAKEFSNIVTYAKEQYEQKHIESTTKRINGRLGTSFSNKEIKDALERLHFRVQMRMDNGYFVANVPAHRLDITCDADLSEEVIRLLGFENVKSTLPCLDTKLGALNESQHRLKLIREYLIEQGLDECVTYSLISKKEKDLFNLLNNEEHYSLLNPISEDREVFRTHILHSLLLTASYNVARQNKNLLLFETSNMMSKTSSSNHLAIVLVGKDETRGLMEKVPFDFYHMKGILEGIFTILGIDSSRYKLEKLDAHKDELHPGKSANIIFQNNVIGRFGELHPNQYAKYDLGKTSAVVLEMNLDPLLTAKVSVLKMSPISKFPSVTRDLALVVEKSIMARELIKTIKTTGRGLVSDAAIFDAYEGEHVKEGFKSVAITITFMSDNHTLNDKEINEMVDKIKFELIKKHHAELRM
ncbi:MAG: phenylalanine--tRNA ligase subunit beta [Bacilli bacterium]|nr:phenylalanine--tRNA ligase subunit beta [Bacilli bacterium]